MSYEIVFTPSAAEDLQLAFEWYERQRKGLGWEFRYEIAICIDKIADDRVSYQVFTGKSRRIPLSRFPYIIYFIKDEKDKHIVIGALLHERINPEEIKRRTPG